ncbi:hypothetical protein Esti_004767 [Eimeria stiedai]
MENWGGGGAAEAEGRAAGSSCSPASAASTASHIREKAVGQDAAGEAAEEAMLRGWFPATRPEFETRCGEVKRLVKGDLENADRRKHLESFRQSMEEWESFDPHVRNDMSEDVVNAFLDDLLKMQPNTTKEFDAASQILRKKYKAAPAKSQLVAAYKRLFVASGGGEEPSNGPVDHPHRLQHHPLRNSVLERLMRRKAVRTNSGVLVITLLTAPGRFSCPQDCHYCPNEPGQPRSYLSTEPAVLRANQNGWSPLKQFKDRAHTLRRNGHVVDKIEVLVLGGTWSGYPQDYQEEFIRDIYYAANVFTQQEPQRAPLSLEEEQELNETAACRIVGLTLETRPDFITRYELRRLRRFGCTRVQIGVQHVDDKILQYINRGCTRSDAIRAIRLLKDAGFKVDIHLMPDLPSSSPYADRQMFYYVLASPDLQADQWKIYPCEVTPFSTIEQWYKEGKFIPYADTDGEVLTSLICSVKAAVHPWVRLNRVVRDIPNQSIIGGNNVTNLRQELASELERRHLRCKCIRCREVKDAQFDLSLAELCIRRYETNGGIEFFLSFETPDRKTIFGFLRLRLRGTRSARDCPFSVLKRAALLRELHVYGCLVPHGEPKGSKDFRPQHAGFGRRLIQAAEIVALAQRYRRMAVIASIGTREYYRASGYHLKDSYMVKELTVSGLHAGRADLLADMPAKLRIEHQDLERAASFLFLPLPPRAPSQPRRKQSQKTRRKRGQGRPSSVDAAEAAEAEAFAHSRESEKQAQVFAAENISKVEEIDVPSLLEKTEKKQQEEAGGRSEANDSRGVFLDLDTYDEWSCRYTANMENYHQSYQVADSHQTAAQQRFLYSLLSTYKQDKEKHLKMLMITATAAVAACGAAGLLFLMARRRRVS